MRGIELPPRLLLNRPGYDRQRMIKFEGAPNHLRLDQIPRMRIAREAEGMRSLIRFGIRMRRCAQQ